MKFLFIAFALSCSTLSAVDLKPAALFADHMVLQRDKPLPVWGWADAGAEVTVGFAGQKKSTIADAAGKWMVKLDPMAANAESQALKIQSGGKAIEISDVLVGEVWLGSGQSNMAMTVSRSRDFATEKASSDLPQIRMFKESSPSAKTPQEDSKGSWAVCTPDSVGGFSATLFFFGRGIHRELKVPIGLINSSVGGTPIESWVAGEAQSASAELAAANAKTIAAMNAAIAQFEARLEKLNALDEEAKAAGKPLPRRPRLKDPREQQKRRGGPGGLFNGKIAPLIPYAIRGAVWYQGEANTHPGKSYLYRYQLPLLITDWRKRWGDDFPFAWVQLPNYNRQGEGWMLVREGMLQSLSLPKTGMAITTDLGDAKDIHPKNKQDVGHRLACWALGDVYKKEVPAVSGAIYDGHTVEGSEVSITFKHGKHLNSKGTKTPKGFVIAGADKIWHPATARIDESTVIVSSPDVTAPVAVRYSWAADPDGNLYNHGGLPASPFRTDDWPIKGETD